MCFLSDSFYYRNPPLNAGIMPTYGALKLRCILVHSHSRGTLKKKKQGRGKTRLSAHASREGLKTGFPRAYVATETPICGWYLWRWPLRRRHLPAIASPASVIRLARGFLHLQCTRVRAHAHAFAMIIQWPRRFEPWRATKKPAVDVVFDVAGILGAAANKACDILLLLNTEKYEAASRCLVASDQLK